MYSSMFNIIINYVFMVDEFGRLSASEILSLSCALCAGNYLVQVEDDAAGLCAQLFDSLPHAIHRAVDDLLRDKEKDERTHIAISGTYST